MYNSQLRRLGERREPAIVLLLSIVTCGIYYFFWLYYVSRETMDYTGEQDIDPGLDVLLAVLTCGLWTIYWDYKIAKRIMRMQEGVGLRVTDNSVLFIILNLVGVGVVNALIEQGSLNEIWDAERARSNSGSF